MSGLGPVVVVGLGNVLRGDDAFGPLVVRMLQASHRFPEDVQVIDAGSPGMDLQPFLLGARAAILVDTVLADVAPGEIVMLGKEEILAGGAVGPRISPHESGIREALWLADVMGEGPGEVVLVGTPPSTVELGAPMSRCVREGAARAATVVLERLEAWGTAGSRRERPVAADVFWERGCRVS